MPTNLGIVPLIGHSGTVSIGGVSVNCVVATLSPISNADTYEMKNGAGEQTGQVWWNERMDASITIIPAAASPSMPLAPAPGTKITLAGFRSAGSTQGRNKVNGDWFYTGGWAPKEAAGQVVEVSFNIRQAGAITPV